MRWIIFALWVLILFSCEDPQGRKPNVIIIMSDDQGYGDFSKFGNPVLRTPNLDKLGEESIRLKDFHVASVCTPTRSQLLTGIDAMHNGAYSPHGQHFLLNRKYKTMGNVFSDNGYNTALYGKWHLGGNFPGYRPHERGFQDAVYFLRGGHGSHPNYWNSDSMDDYYYHNGTLEKFQGYATDLWFELGEAFVRKSKNEGKPFFLYLPLNAPHVPWLAPSENQAPYLNKGLDKETINFFAMIDAMDKRIGQFVDMLKKEDVWDNTIFIFLTDNGSALTKQEFNAGLRGKKGSPYEGGHRVPFFISWPDGDLRDQGDIDALLECQDVLPTLVELCDLTLKSEIDFHGTSFAKTLMGKPQTELKDRVLVAQHTETQWRAAVMWNKWRLIDGTELFDVTSDSLQEHNVAAQHPYVVEKLRAHYQDWWKEAERTIDDPAPYYFGRDTGSYMLTAYDWYWGKRVFNWPHLRAGDTGNGKYKIIFEAAGTYRITLMRWPEEAKAGIREGVPAFTPFDPLLGDLEEGKALDIRQAKIMLGDQQAIKPVGEDAVAVTFEMDVRKGDTFLQTWFIDSKGTEFGAYYVYLKRAEVL